MERRAKLIDGKQLAANLRGEIAAGVAALKAEKGVTPGLAVILVGDNPASVSYVTAKEKACAEAGMYSREIRMPATIAESELLDKIAALNADPAIHGILVQLPLPKGFDEKKVIRAIAPEKDVDGFTPINVGKMLIGEPCFLPCTPHGIIKLIEFSGMDVRGKHAAQGDERDGDAVPYGHAGHLEVHEGGGCRRCRGGASEYGDGRHAEGGSGRHRRGRQPRSGRDEAERIPARGRC